MKNNVGAITQIPDIKKTMKNIITLALLVAGAAVTANAQSIISWKDNNGTTIPATGYAGVVSATNWNVNTGSANLSYNDASLSGTTLSLAGGVGQWGIGGAVQDPNGSYNSALFSGYYNTGTSETLSLTGISYSLYNVIVYFSSDTDGRTGTISDGATTYSFSTDTRAKVDAHSNFVFAQTTDTGLSHPSADYAVFSGLTGASETLTIANASGGMGIAGVQIVAAPEPGTMALAALGGASLLFWRRRSK
jgi:PEP-CTERM motif